MRTSSAIVALALCAAISERSDAQTGPQTLQHSATMGHDDITPLAEVTVIGEPSDPSMPDLILVPGIGLSWHVWEPWMERNADRFRMHAVTLPGMAGTEPPPTPTDEDGATPWLHNAADAIARYIEHADLDRPIVIGHGTGGMAALHTGTRHPELVRAYASITMPAAFPIDRRPVTRGERLDYAYNFVQTRNAELGEAEARAQLSRIYAASAPIGPVRDAALVAAVRCEPHVLTQYWTEVVATDLVAEIAALETLPVLICLPLQGSFPRQPERWHAIADACDAMLLVEFSGSASFCHEDEPERFMRSLDALIARAERYSDDR
ncbi:MAG: alpha/beta hydrolase [Planctomycetota bacterium]